MQVHVCTPSKAPFIPFLSWHHCRKNVSPRKEGADFLRAPRSSPQPQRKLHVCVCTRTIVLPVIGEGPCFGGGGVKKTFAFFLEGNAPRCRLHYARSIGYYGFKARHSMA